MAEDEEIELLQGDTVCSICYAEFLDVEDLEIHISQVHSTSGVHCHFCSSKFSDLVKYAFHLRDVHLLQLRSCKFCTKLFTNDNDLLFHERKHAHYRKKTPYKCSQCRAILKTLTELQYHELMAHNNSEDGVFINDCLPMLSSHLAMKTASFLQALASNGTFNCVKCKLKTTDATEYLEHLREKECKALACSRCSNVYKFRYKLIKHLNLKRDCQLIYPEVESKIKCTKCHNKLSKRIYANHIKNCSPIKCGICDLIFDTMDEMTRHQTEKHPRAITMEICQFCHREFVGSVTLQKHIDRSHKKYLHLYKYKCIYCENTIFKHPKDLFAHFFSTHQSLQPFSCQICNLTFRVRKKFTLHIKLTHSSDGVIEFDENYHVHFAKEKSENAFQPKSLFAEQIDEIGTDCETDIEKGMNEAQTDAPTDAQTDAPTDAQTDAQTDTEDKTKGLLIPIKLRFKKERKSIGYTQEGTQEEIKNDEKKPSRKRRFSKRTPKTDPDNTQISDEEPLSAIKKKITKKPKSKIKSFTCPKCNKYCYTYQNYTYHVATHNQNEMKQCVKCSKTFYSTSKLKTHMQKAHSGSRLTEHLKRLLERKRKGIATVQPEKTQAEKFLQTFKKVKSEPVRAAASIKEVNDKLSAKNFLETFTPEEEKNSKKNLDIQMSVSIRTIQNPIKKPPAIKMTRFIPKPIPKSVKLSMPVKFKNVVSNEKVKVSVAIVQKYAIPEPDHEEIHDYDNTEYVEDYQNDDYHEDTNVKGEVPEVAQEVMLESQETPQTNNALIQQRVLIPKLPNVDPTEIKIAHLLPSAPYFKIAKLDDLLHPTEKKVEVQEEPVVLPSGRKLINVNPLAHLLGDTPVEQIVAKTRNKYYKRKTESYETAIAKALLKLDQDPPIRKKKKANKEEIK